MRRAQASIEVVLAVTLLSITLAAAGASGFAAWQRAELQVSRLAAQRAAERGGDPRLAASDVLPAFMPREAALPDREAP